MIVVCIRSSDGILRHYKAMTARLIAFFYTDKVLDIQIMRKDLKKKVKEIVNNFGPQLFKNFDTQGGIKTSIQFWLEGRIQVNYTLQVKIKSPVQRRFTGWSRRSYSI